MPTPRVTLDEFQVTFRIRPGQSADAVAAARRVLTSFRFARRLKRLARRLVRTYPALGPVTVRVTR
jgi:hypothetical protein